MVYDTSRDRMVLFGGANAASDPILAETWVFRVFGTPCAVDDDCSLGNCVDGACCATPSCSDDQTCNSAAQRGTCLAR
jgi:hypothetical protein